MHKGYLAIILHAHLPFVRHPEHADFLEEDWLYEAITETYIPLIQTMQKLADENVDFRLSISLSPPLMFMLQDDLLQKRYLAHLDKLIELSYREIDRTRGEQAFNRLAHMYNQKFLEARNIFENVYHRNLLHAFKKFQDMGKIEIMTSSATHAFLPLSQLNPLVVRAQIGIAANYYKEIFGRYPRGMWLPECGFYPGVDEYLKEFNIRFFILDTHGILHGSPRPRYGIFAPVYCKSGVAAFGRDIESSKAVWSAIEGYPGDYNYREFYRDIGFDLDFNYIKPYIHPDGIRINTGIKYFRITGPTDHKEPYVPEWAMDKAAYHAGNFMFNRQKQASFLKDFLDREPIIVSPYDAELFGHWWYEGPDWLYFLAKKIHFDQDEIKMVTPIMYLEENPTNQVMTPSFSSWGWKGYAEYWLEGSNDWIYRHMHKAEERMIELAQNNSNPPTELIRRALNQAARELVLAQSSDWAFIMKTGTVTSYAVMRFKNHILRFNRLYWSIRKNSVDEGFLSDIEYKDNIFPNIDYRIYRG